MLQPKPQLSRIEWANDIQAHAELMHMIQKRKVVIDHDTQLFKDLELWLGSRREQMIPSVHALIVLVNGFLVQALKPMNITEDEQYDIQ
jgi:hypothetical protein